MSTTTSIPLSLTITTTTTPESTHCTPPPPSPLSPATPHHHRHDTTKKIQKPIATTIANYHCQHLKNHNKKVQQNHHKNHRKSSQNHQRNFCWGLQRRKTLHNRGSEEISDPLSPWTLMDTIGDNIMPEVYRTGPTSEEHRTPHSGLCVAVVDFTSPSSWVAVGVEW
ncbi:Hypothetical predicted protein [Olea europaea subsp. europaea]|uniref:Uncharacterized protein n=1 Tax=Olea europaea subsp. europaea TaxID=158383 RepID=A0A8S0Q231_OLEEU|nr:Hypothetical predicted protein [Olea europaea subsp. europaea]